MSDVCPQKHKKILSNYNCLVGETSELNTSAGHHKNYQ